MFDSPGNCVEKRVQECQPNYVEMAENLGKKIQVIKNMYESSKEFVADGYLFNSMNREDQRMVYSMIGAIDTRLPALMKEHIKLVEMAEKQQEK